LEMVMGLMERHSHTTKYKEKIKLRIVSKLRNGVGTCWNH
jgi:hypothetical protein